ncbi:MAG: hypothetical protein WBL63_25715 [Candidatus Acidiferrum sp.]
MKLLALTCEGKTLQVLAADIDADSNVCERNPYFPFSIFMPSHKGPEYSSFFPYASAAPQT